MNFYVFMQILEGLLKLPENRECADCKAKYVFRRFERDKMDVITVNNLVFRVEIDSITDLLL